MTITRHSSGNLNDVRAYPLADDASRRADDGAVLPESVINDCHVWWPNIYGETAFIASVTVSPSLVTATIAAENSSSGEVTLLAAVQISRPVVPYRSCPLQSFQAGVGGWLAPGKLPDSLQGVNTWLFSTASQSKLLPRLSQAYPALPVTSVGEEGNNRTLTGSIKLVAGRDLQIEEGYRYIDGLYTRCIVFSLAEDQLPDLYEYYAGPCGRRPESDNCSKTPIRSVGGVPPDCSGTVFVDIDDSNGVIESRIDATDGELGNAALFTPIEYVDACGVVSGFDVLYEDQCESSLLGEPDTPLSSSSGTGPDEASSSSASPYQTKRYIFDLPADLFDFAAFSDAKEIERDYEIPATVYGGESRISWTSGELALRTSDVKQRVTRIANTVKNARLSEVGDWAEVEAVVVVSREDVLASASYSSGENAAEFRVAISSKGLIDVSETEGYGERSIRANVRLVKQEMCYEGDVREVAAVVCDAEWFGGSVGAGHGWQTINTTPTESMSLSYTMYPVPCGVEFNSSSSLSVGLDECSSSSLSPRCVDDLPDAITIRVRLRVEVLAPQEHSSSSAGGGYEFGVSLDMEVSQEGVDPRLTPDTDNNQTAYGRLDPRSGYPATDSGGDWHDLQFFDVSVMRHNDDSLATGPFHIVPFRLSELSLVASDLNTQSCGEDDFESSPSRVDYLVKYVPADGWSNDFSVRRAVEQFEFLSPYLSPKYPEADEDGFLSLPQQYLDARGGATHKPAVLRCQPTSADAYVYSAAFKKTTGNVKYGLILGYQGNASNVFWAVVIDPAGQRITYGVHYLGYFLAAGWSPLPLADPSWQYAWHRLVVRISSGYTVQAWVDPSIAGNSSSSAGGTKRIPINYASPQYTITPIAAWDGNLSGLPQTEFAEGNPGLYVFGGEAYVAEFTASPNNQDIVVPNKVPWLGDV